MSFSVKTKNELARIATKKRCCQSAELAALIKMDGVVQISNGQLALNITNDNAAVARKIFSLLKELMNIHTEILIRRRNRLKKNNSYVVRVSNPEKVKEILGKIKVLRKEGGLSYKIGPIVKNKECCKRSYLRGVFLGGGSVNNPEGNYHLEIITNNSEHAEAIAALLNEYDLSAKTSNRKNWFVVYLKESEQIVELLNLMGAHNALLNFENARIYKGVRNKVNRLVNCETANLNKTVNAALRQVENIKVIEQRIGLNKLPSSLREIAEMRLEYPDVSLKELGELLEPPVGKSGVNHRIRKLEKIAEKLKS